MANDLLYVTWNSELETGNSKIDQQHEGWIAAVNNLFASINDNKGAVEIKKTMKFLIEYTNIHFSDEEELQIQFDYPKYKSHKQLHLDFKLMVINMSHTLDEQGATDDFINNTCVTMGHWVINHIKKEDFKLVAHILTKEKEANN